MRGGGGGEIGGIRPGDLFSYTMGLRASSKQHGGRRCPTATMGPHYWLLCIQQTGQQTMEQVYVV
jgi:hypothetical protein